MQVDGLGVGNSLTLLVESGVAPPTSVRECSLTHWTSILGEMTQVSLVVAVHI